MFYVILRIETGKTIYNGISLTKAAKSLRPGTCYGVSENPPAAFCQAMVRREKFLSIPSSS